MHIRHDQMSSFSGFVVAEESKGRSPFLLNPGNPDYAFFLHEGRLSEPTERNTLIARQLLTVTHTSSVSKFAMPLQYTALSVT